MRLLYITTIGGTMTFFKAIIKELIDEGHIVDIATNENSSMVPDCYRKWGCKVFSISTSRSPFSLGNIKAINEIRKIAKSYDIVHCHTPLAGMATRLACIPLRKNGTKVIYTAHGFHFYTGAPLKNWLIYYPVEWVCSHWTDVLITINKEDFERAKKHMHAKRVEYVPGVGIDISKYKNTIVNMQEKRQEIGVPLDAFMVLSVGELNENKNHISVIKAIKGIANNNIHYVIVGTGNLKSLLDINDNVHLLGRREDCNELYKVCDLYIHPSYREGLPVALMEAIASGARCIASKVRGCEDLLDEGLFYPSDVNGIIDLIINPPKGGVLNSRFSINNVNKAIKKIYAI